MAVSSRCDTLRGLYGEWLAGSESRRAGWQKWPAGLFQNSSECDLIDDNRQITTLA